MHRLKLPCGSESPTRSLGYWAEAGTALARARLERLFRARAQRCQPRETFKRIRAFKFTFEFNAQA